ncbi:MAG: ATP-binding protein [bacterium]|nr:ATP-binding protein [bacterium]
MRLKWQLTLGGGLLVAGVLLLADLYVGGGSDPTQPTRRIGDPQFILLVLSLGALAGAGMAWAIKRPLVGLTRALRTAEAAWARGESTKLSAISPTPAQEVVDLYGAANALHNRQAEIATDLASENSRLEIIFDSISEGLLVTDRHGRLIAANRALRDLFGINWAVEGRPAVEAVRNAAVGDAIDQALLGQTPECEITFAGERNLSVHAAPILASDGSGPVGTVTMFYEITRLRRLERMRADFVANVSHELRTPLTAIKGCAETLADGALQDPQAAARFVDVIATHADRLTRILEDLLSLSRLESEQTRVEMADANVQKIVQTACEAVSRIAADRKITVTTEIADGLRARCERRLIEQALINLLDNAVKYSPEGGSVVIRAKRQTRSSAAVELAGRLWSAGGSETTADESGTRSDDAIVVEVADRGVGIPPAEVERVFERFYRVDRGRSRAMGGTGLGLSITRHIIALHGERVFVDSEFGVGSVFGFTLSAA